MKREWEVNWKVIENLSWAYFWFTGVGAVAWTIYWNSHHHPKGRDVPDAPIRAAQVWIGPYVLVACGVGLMFVTLAVGVLWKKASAWRPDLREYIPVRRVTKPVVEDLREVGKKQWP
jgi:hypothetical protein